MKKNNTFIKKFILSLITNPDTNQNIFTKKDYKITQSNLHPIFTYSQKYRTFEPYLIRKKKKKENVKSVQIR